MSTYTDIMYKRFDIDICKLNFISEHAIRQYELEVQELELVALENGGEYIIEKSELENKFEEKQKSVFKTILEKIKQFMDTISEKVHNLMFKTHKDEIDHYIKNNPDKVMDLQMDPIKEITYRQELNALYLKEITDYISMRKVRDEEEAKRRKREDAIRKIKSVGKATLTIAAAVAAIRKFSQVKAGVDSTIKSVSEKIDKISGFGSKEAEKIRNTLNSFSQNTAQIGKTVTGLTSSIGKFVFGGAPKGNGQKKPSSGSASTPLKKFSDQTSKPTGAQKPGTPARRRPPGDSSSPQSRRPRPTKN